MEQDKFLKFNKLFSLINNQKYDEITKIIQDVTIQTLIKNIVFTPLNIMELFRNSFTMILSIFILKIISPCSILILQGFKPLKN